MTVEFSAPLRLKTQTNQSRDWRARSAEVRRVRNAVTLLWLAHVGKRYPIKPPYLVTLTRIGPRRIDDDNLRAAWKAGRDSIACHLCVNDGDTGKIQFLYEQERGPFGIRVRLQTRDGNAGTVASPW